MDPLGIVLLVIAGLLTALHLATRRSVRSVRRAERKRSLRFARLAVSTWLRHRDGEPAEPSAELIDAARELRTFCREQRIDEPPEVRELLCRDTLVEMGDHARRVATGDVQARVTRDDEVLRRAATTR